MPHCPLSGGSPLFWLYPCGASGGTLETLLSALPCLSPHCCHCKCLSHVFLASSLFLVFPRNHPDETSRNWMCCQGQYGLPMKTSACILQEQPCARTGGTDGWTCRTSFSHKCSEHHKCSVAFFFFFWKLKYIWEVLVQTTDPVKY